MNNNRNLVYIGVFLIAVSNAVKGTFGLAALDDFWLNVVASVLLSLGVEILLFYAVMSWSSNKQRRSLFIYASIITLGAWLLNYLFFMERLEQPLSLLLAATGPVVASLGGLVVGEVEEVDRRHEQVDHEHEQHMAELAIELAKQERLTKLHERKAIEAGQVVNSIGQVVQLGGQEMTKDDILDQMLTMWQSDGSISLRSMTDRFPVSYGTLRNYKEELISAGQLQVRGGQYTPMNGH